MMIHLKKTLLIASLALLAAQAIAQSPPRLRTPTVEGWEQVPAAKLEQQARDFPESFFLEGPGDRKEIAFTFDDGPSADTAALLDLLKKENVKATFFWQGSQIEKFPELARRAYAEGHTLANHSYNHPRLIPLEGGNQWWSQQIEKTQAVFQKTLGFQPSMMRPPYGFISDNQVQFLQQKKMYTILWSVDTADWYHTHKNSFDELAASKIASVVHDYLHPEAIVLMHDSGGRGRKPTIIAVAQLIPELKRKGYRFTTVDQLLNIPSKLNQVRPEKSYQVLPFSQ